MLIKSQRPALRNADGTFPKTNESSLYSRTIVENSALTHTNHALEQLDYLDGGNKILHSFRGKLYNLERNDGAIAKSIAKKLSGVVWHTKI